MPDNGQVERMNRTIKDATVKRFYYETHDELRAHLADFETAYNFAKRLKTLKGLTPYEYICKAWTKEPERFTLNPLQQMPGLNNYAAAFSSSATTGSNASCNNASSRLRRASSPAVRLPFSRPHRTISS
jgi:hypothetical protein